MAILEVINLKKTYTTRFGGSQVRALKNVNFTVENGEYAAVMGESGSGKTTLLNILAALDRPSYGTVLLDGRDITKLKDKELSGFRRDNLGFVFQSFNLIDELNVFENVELPLTYLGIKSSERRRMVEDILKRMNISHRAKHFPQQLSGGQQQRVTNPKLILADEPTGNLDSKNGAEVMTLLTELNKEGTTIIMVTHSQHDASFAHRTVHLFDGSVVASVTA